MTLKNIRQLGMAAIVGIAAIAAVPAAHAVPVIVSQESSAGAGDFDANILGTIDPFDTLLSASDYYAYDPNEFSFKGSFPLVNDRSNLFLVNSAVDGLVLMLVHDKPLNADGGLASLRFDLTGDPNGASVLVSDEPGEAVSFDANTIFMDHEWFFCCTDGAAIGSIDGNFEAFVQFLAAPFGLTEWLATSSGGSSIALSLDPNRRVRLSLGVIPEPATASLLLGMAGLALLGRRRKTAK